MKFILKKMFYTNSIIRRVWYAITTSPQKYINMYLLCEKKHTIRVADMVYNLLRYGCQYDEYFMFDFQHKSSLQKREFITDCTRYKIYKKFNCMEDDLLLNDKYATYMKFKKYFKREVILIKNEKDYCKFENFISKHESFLIKQLSLSCGQGIEFYEKSDINVQELFLQLQKKMPFILEEKILQNDLLAKFHPASVNTIRICSVMPKGGKYEDIQIYDAIFRCGKNNKKVDNGGAGGILSSIDLKSGKICTDGVDEKCNRYIEHPDTKMEFYNYQIPEWEQCIALTKELQSIIPKHRYTAWDLAYSNKGWCLVEGNAGGQFSVLQIPSQAGKKSYLEKFM